MGGFIKTIWQYETMFERKSGVLLDSMWGKPGKGDAYVERFVFAKTRLSADTKLAVV